MEKETSKSIENRNSAEELNEDLTADKLKLFQRNSAISVKVRWCYSDILEQIWIVGDVFCSFSIPVEQGKA